MFFILVLPGSGRRVGESHRGALPTELRARARRGSNPRLPLTVDVDLLAFVRVQRRRGNRIGPGRLRPSARGGRRVDGKSVPVLCLSYALARGGIRTRDPRINVDLAGIRPRSTPTLRTTR